MKGKTIKVVCTMLLAVIMFGFASMTATATTIDYHSMPAMNAAMDTDGREYKYLKYISNKTLSKYYRPTVTVGNKTLSVKGVELNGVYYIPFRQAASAIEGSVYNYDYKTKTATLKAPGLDIVAGDGCYVTYANGRTLFNTTPNVIMNDGRLYIPATVFAKAVGMNLDSQNGNVRISGAYAPILSAEKFYRSDEVFWLARIIHAESKGEALIGQIAVGNVVLNRVKSAYYPNTIYGVIFDRKYGVQFSPILDGSIYNTPGYSATLAAKICLEGYDVSEGVFFFLNVKLATSSWIPKNREYAFTIGNHDFYK